MIREAKASDDGFVLRDRLRPSGRLPSRRARRSLARRIWNQLVMNTLTIALLLVLAGLGSYIAMRLADRHFPNRAADPARSAPR